MPITLPEIPECSVGDVETAAIDGTLYLDGTEVFTGTPTVTEITTSDLTISNEAVSTAVISFEWGDAAIGQAIQFSVQGQMANILYQLQITCSTDSTPARTKTFYAWFQSH